MFIYAIRKNRKLYSKICSSNGNLKLKELFCFVKGKIFGKVFACLQKILRDLSDNITERLINVRKIS